MDRRIGGWAVLAAFITVGAVAIGKTTLLIISAVGIAAGLWMILDIGLRIEVNGLYETQNRDDGLLCIIVQDVLVSVNTKAQIEFSLVFPDELHTNPVTRKLWRQHRSEFNEDVYYRDNPKAFDSGRTERWLAFLDARYDLPLDQAHLRFEVVEGIYLGKKSGTVSIPGKSKLRLFRR